MDSQSKASPRSRSQVGGKKPPRNRVDYIDQPAPPGSDTPTREKYARSANRAISAAQEAASPIKTRKSTANLGGTDKEARPRARSGRYGSGGRSGARALVAGAR